MGRLPAIVVLVLAPCFPFEQLAPAGLIVLDAAADATLYEDPTGSLANGSGSHLFAGMNSQGLRRRSLIRFDVASALPSGAVVLSATLTLHLSQGSSDPTLIELHRLLASWGEGASDPSGSEGAGAPAGPGDATWTHRFFGGDAWSTPGGDFDPVGSANALVAGVGFWSWSSTAMTADVQAWLDNPASAAGWILLGDEGLPGSARRFDARENIEALFRPTLALEYSIVPAPGGATVLLLAAVRRRRRARAD